MNTFGSRLKKLRTSKRKLQKEVAMDLELSKTGYSSYENDLRMPGIRMLVKIADYYGVSADYLLGRNNISYIDNDKLIKELETLERSIALLKKYIKENK